MHRDAWDEDEDEADDFDESPDEDDDETTTPCPYCKRLIYDDSLRCPHCGNYLSAEDSPSARKPWWIIVGTVLLLLVVYWWIAG